MSNNNIARRLSDRIELVATIDMVMKSQLKEFADEVRDLESEIESLRDELSG